MSIIRGWYTKRCGPKQVREAYVVCNGFGLPDTRGPVERAHAAFSSRYVVKVDCVAITDNPSRERLTIELQPTSARLLAQQLIEQADEAERNR